MFDFEPRQTQIKFKFKLAKNDLQHWESRKFCKKSLDLFFLKWLSRSWLARNFYGRKKSVFFTLPFAHFRVDTAVFPNPWCGDLNLLVGAPNYGWETLIYGNAMCVTPLPLFIELILHMSSMNNWQVEYFNIDRYFYFYLY